VIHGRRHVGHNRRMPVGAPQDEGAESLSLRVAGKRSKAGPAL
jgi:hypothetical protein